MSNCPQCGKEEGLHHKQKHEYECWVCGAVCKWTGDAWIIIQGKEGYLK